MIDGVKTTYHPSVIKIVAANKALNNNTVKKIINRRKADLKDFLPSWGSGKSLIACNMLSQIVENT